MKEDYKLMEEGLLKERDRLLKKYPELIKFQLEIDAVMAEYESKDSTFRAQKLTELLVSKMITELIPANEKLREIQERIKAMEDAA